MYVLLVGVPFHLLLWTIRARAENAMQNFIIQHSERETFMRRPNFVIVRKLLVFFAYNIRPVYKILLSAANLILFCLENFL